MPQIANDLRTELFPDAVDIFYSWIRNRTLSNNLASNSSSRTTSPIKLTTWRIANAYQSVNVLPPSGIRDGEAWNLVLSPHKLKDGNHVINMVEDSDRVLLGQTPFPVISQPVRFCRRLAGDGTKYKQKQERIERIYRLSLQGGSKIDIKITENTSFDLDKVRSTRTVYPKPFIVNACAEDLG